MKNRKKARFRIKKGFATVPTSARIMKKLREVSELRILDLEGKWIMTFKKVEPPPKDKEWDADTYEQNKN